MATIGELHVKITGIGRSRFGLWLMGVVARAFRIDLDIKVKTDSKKAFDKLKQAVDMDDSAIVSMSEKMMKNNDDCDRLAQNGTSCPNQ